mgnify:CR=1 FL=1
MAQTVSDLEADGLVTREPDPRDGRRALVELTQEGRLALEAERRRREGWLANAIANDLSLEEQSLLSDTIDLLRRLAEARREGEPREDV